LFPTQLLLKTVEVLFNCFASSYAVAFWL